MHMADALISPAVGAAMYGVSIGANAYAVKSVKNDGLSDKKIPVMGVMGAFVFAAQMVNFTIPFTGSSGHIAGGVLLAALLGGSRALLSVTCVLIIQCLFFADGGLLALGCNIFNMGVIPCLIVYPLIFKPIAAKFSWRRLGLASVAASVSAMLSGAFCVTAQTYASGVTALPFKTFLLLMLPIHLAIGLAEGVITAAVLCCVNQTRPEILRMGLGAEFEKIPIKKTVAVFALLAVLTGGALSLFGEKYGEIVRVVAIGDFSKEFCGGHHVENTGDIKVFKLVSESALSTGIRRIEAVAGSAVNIYYQKEFEKLNAELTKLDLPAVVFSGQTELKKLAEQLKNGYQQIENKKEQLKNEQKQLEKQKLQAALARLDEYTAQKETINNIPVIAVNIGEADRAAVNAVADSLRNYLGEGVVVLGAADAGKAVLLAVVTKKYQTPEFNANKIIQKIAPLVDGRGGGKPDTAQAGGRNPGGIPAALQAAKEMLRK